MVRGRKPKPAALKALDGNPGKRKFTAPALPAFPGPPPLKCPMHILGHARAEWKRLVAELTRLGLIAAVAPAALETYATTYALWRKAKTELNRKATRLIIETESGYQLANPLIGIVNTAATQLRAWLSEFGLTPTSRARVGPIAQPQGDAFDDFMQHKNTG